MPESLLSDSATLHMPIHTVADNPDRPSPNSAPSRERRLRQKHPSLHKERAVLGQERKRKRLAREARERDMPMDVDGASTTLEEEEDVLTCTLSRSEWATSHPLLTDTLIAKHPSPATTAMSMDLNRSRTRIRPRGSGKCVQSRREPRAFSLPSLGWTLTTLPCGPQKTTSPLEASTLPSSWSSRHVSRRLVICMSFPCTNSSSQTVMMCVRFRSL